MSMYLRRERLAAVRFSESRALSRRRAESAGAPAHPALYTPPVGPVGEDGWLGLVPPLPEAPEGATAEELDAAIAAAGKRATVLNDLLQKPGSSAERRRRIMAEQERNRVARKELSCRRHYLRANREPAPPVEDPADAVQVVRALLTALLEAGEQIGTHRITAADTAARKAARAFLKLNGGDE